MRALDENFSLLISYFVVVLPVCFPFFRKTKQELKFV